MNERRRHDLWRRMGLDVPESDTVWDRVGIACAMVRNHVRVDAVVVSVSYRGWGTTVGTDQWAERLEEYQHTLGEGPSPEVIRSGLAVLVPDLLAKRNKWSIFTERAQGSGLAAIFAVPIPGVNGNPLGALTLYRRTTGSLSTAELRHVAIMAGFTAKLIELDDDDPLVATGPRDRHALISSATDLLATRHSVSREDALVLLRAHAFVQDRSLHHVAKAVVDQDLWGTSLDDDQH